MRNTLKLAEKTDKYERDSLCIDERILHEYKRRRKNS